MGGAVITHYIGIDPGVHTGYAVWDAENLRLTDVSTIKLHQLFERVLDLDTHAHLKVFFEDARLRTGWFGPNSRQKQQGAGSIKRDCSAIEDFLLDWEIPYQAISPKSKGAKVSESMFKAVSGWELRTSQHARDAAMLVIGRKAVMEKST